MGEGWLRVGRSVPICPRTGVKPVRGACLRARGVVVISNIDGIEGIVVIEEEEGIGGVDDIETWDSANRASTGAHTASASSGRRRFLPIVTAGISDWSSDGVSAAVSRGLLFEEIAELLLDGSGVFARDGVGREENTALEFADGGTVTVDTVADNDTEDFGGASEAGFGGVA